MADQELSAVLGGAPVFDKPYHLVRPSLPPFEDFVEDLKRIYSTRMLSNQGYFVKKMEKRIANELGVEHCAAFCNGTIAIMALVKALGISGKVLVPSFTFAATVQALLWQDLQPQFVDIDPKTLTMDPAETEAAIGPETAAIFPVNIFGTCCDHEKMAHLARKHELALFYDSAQAFGTRYKGNPVGSLGDAEVFSFHATKVFHTGEGGAVTTNDAQLYKKLCKIRNFGFSGYLNCTEPGLNGKMSELPALLGLRLLDNLHLQSAKRQALFETYKAKLVDIPGVFWPETGKDVQTNYAYFIIGVEPSAFGLSSIELNYALTAENIVSRCYFFPPVHRTAYYQQRPEFRNVALPNTDWAARHILCLPVHTEMTPSELSMIVKGLWRCHRNAGAIRERIASKIPANWEDVARNRYVDPYDTFVASHLDSGPSDDL